MSAYMSFFIRSGDDFYPIGTYSRSHVIYQLFNDNGCGPWEKISPITFSDIHTIRADISKRIEDYKDGIQEYKDKIEFLKRCDSSMADKIHYYNDYNEVIKEYEDDISWLEHCRAFATFIENIMEEYRYTYDEDNKDPEKYVYCGIEVYKPTMEDII